ncbi:ArsR/SmtB family transcription factor [Halobellus marinus]|uniref:ArsR/SmtB family transcription factor n=1 Tax=Halobellus TaxID=1073986 RepID=UPI0028AB31C1|nr:helix-turn-helix domain-containing protein [Halobellus sp. DFY28]
MPTAFPHHNPVDHTPRGQTSVVVDNNHPTNVLQTISSDTAQQILAALDDGPATTSDIAEVADTSIQNAKYHLEHLCEAGVVEAVDTWYSTKGTEMTVYALAVEELVIHFTNHTG